MPYPTPLPWWMDQSLPPPATMGEEPTTAPALAPGMGGPGSYPAPTPYPTPNYYNTVFAGRDLTFSPGDYPYTPYLDVPLVPPPPIQDIPFENYAGTEAVSPELFPGGIWPGDQGEIPQPEGIADLVSPPNLETTRPAWTQNPPGVQLGWKDRLRMMGIPIPSQFNLGGWGQPMGTFSPGTTHPPGTFGIVNPSMPSGGGSYFGNTVGWWPTAIGFGGRYFGGGGGPTSPLTWGLSRTGQGPGGGGSGTLMASGRSPAANL